MKTRPSFVDAFDLQAHALGQLKVDGVLKDAITAELQLDLQKRHTGLGGDPKVDHRHGRSVTDDYLPFFPPLDSRVVLARVDLHGVLRTESPVHPAQGPLLLHRLLTPTDIAFVSHAETLAHSWLLL